MDTSLLPEHYAHISDLSGENYRAFCRCGFTGAVHHRDFAAAKRDRDEHIRATTPTAGAAGGSDD